MKTSLIQLDIQYESKSINYLNAEKYISEASANGSDIVFFPEMSFTVFSMNVNKNEDNEKKLLKK